jgi:hypothetical protein
MGSLSRGRTTIIEFGVGFGKLPNQKQKCFVKVLFAILPTLEHMSPTNGKHDSTTIFLLYIITFIQELLNVSVEPARLYVNNIKVKTTRFGFPQHEFLPNPKRKPQLTFFF